MSDIVFRAPYTPTTQKIYSMLASYFSFQPESCYVVKSGTSQTTYLQSVQELPVTCGPWASKGSEGCPHLFSMGKKHVSLWRDDSKVHRKLQHDLSFLINRKPSPFVYRFESTAKRIPEKEKGQICKCPSIHASYPTQPLQQDAKH